MCDLLQNASRAPLLLRVHISFSEKDIFENNVKQVNGKAFISLHVTYIKINIAISSGLCPCLKMKTNLRTKRRRNGDHSRWLVTSLFSNAYRTGSLIVFD